VKTQIVNAHITSEEKKGIVKLSSIPNGNASNIAPTIAEINATFILRENITPIIVDIITKPILPINVLFVFGILYGIYFDNFLPKIAANVSPKDRYNIPIDAILTGKNTTVIRQPIK